MPDFAACRATLHRYLKARIPFISLRTDERDRALDLFRELAEELHIAIYYHSLSQGMRDLASNRVVNEDRSVAGALDYVGQQVAQRQNLTFVLTEIQDLDGDNAVTRHLLDVVHSATDKGGTVAAITSGAAWSRLQRQGMSVMLDLPTIDEMRDIVDNQLAPYRGSMPIEWSAPELLQAATILTGVTRVEAENAIVTLLAKGGVAKDDLAELAQVKDRIFSDISGLERVLLAERDPSLGGLQGLRAWLEKQRPLLTMDLRERGLRPPRGVLLVGVPGCGKSLSAKAIAASWNLSLYRLDLANIHGQYLGQSESRLREALATADRVAPAVLWIDEIEKGLAGTESGGDGGTSSRLVGHFLYWLQESRARVFVVATANNVSRLPAELFRRGRFDEIFFVDLPTTDERREILELYSRRYLRKSLVGSPLLESLLEISDGFAGSDLEAAVAEVAKHELLTGEQAADDDYWQRVFTNTVPLSKTSPEAIESIRAWGRDRAVPAAGVLANAPEVAQGRHRRSVLI
jgi:ATPase family associated with various cellular activities (AAA)